MTGEIAASCEALAAGGAGEGLWKTTSRAPATILLLILHRWHGWHLSLNVLMLFRRTIWVIAMLDHRDLLLQLVWRWVAHAILKSAHLLVAWVKGRRGLRGVSR